MSQTLTISDELYMRLETETRAEGLDSIERLLERKHSPAQQINEEELRRRRESGRQADRIRERIGAKCGTMPDSTPLLREDRER